MSEEKEISVQIQIESAGVEDFTGMARESGLSFSKDPRTTGLFEKPAPLPSDPSGLTVFSLVLGSSAAWMTLATIIKALIAKRQVEVELTMGESQLKIKADEKNIEGLITAFSRTSTPDGNEQK